MKRFDPSRAFLGRSLYLATLTVVHLAVLGEQASGQVGVDDYTKPILTRNGLSHYAPIKDLAFASDGNELLSAGLDKVIHVWDVANRSPRPIRTIRPPIFKGEAGQIWSIALSSVVENGQSLLAVAGHSPGSDTGSIVLMRYPGKDPINVGGSGELLGYLQNPKGRRAKEDDVTGKITNLAFTRDGRFLVSADFAGFMNIWDLSEVGKTRVGVEAVSKLEPLFLARPLANRWPITAMVLAGDVTQDRWIITGDTEGRVIRRDLTNQETVSLLQLDPKSNDSVTCLGGGGSLPWVVVGSKNGELRKVDIAGNTNHLLREANGRIVAVDASPDGGRIVASVRKNGGLDVSAPPPIDGCDVLLFENRGGNNWNFRPLHSGRFPIEAVRFGPNRLAFGGDEDQTVTMRDGPAFATDRLRLPGQGSVIWDVGFVGEKGLGVAFSRDSRDYLGRRPGATYGGFDLGNRLPARYQANQIFRSLEVTPRDPRTLQVRNVQISREIVLDPIRDGRWYSYVLLASTIEGGAPLLAVGTEFGISVFNLRDGKRTRFLQGHEATVTVLGVSRDGKWLVSGSADQSIRLWAVKDFDRVIAFGARADLIDGKLVVSSVDKESVAEQRGLRAREGAEKDTIEKAYIDTDRSGTSILREIPLAEFIERAESLEADHEIRLVGTHASGDPLNFLAKKRQAPILSLFLDKGPSREWVLWTPQGYYATSILGDDRYLGWHRNQMIAGRATSTFFTDTERTIFSPISLFKERLQDNAFIDRLIASNDPVAEPVKPVGPIVVAPEPRITREPQQIIVRVPIEDVNAEEPAIDIRENGRPLPRGEIGWVKLGTSYVGTLGKKSLDSFGVATRLRLQRISQEWKSPPVNLDITNPNPSLPSRPGRLVVFSCAVEGSPQRLKVAGANRDVEDLRDFFREKGHLVSSGDGRSFDRNSRIFIQPQGVEKPSLPGKKEPRFDDPSTEEFLKRFVEVGRVMGMDGGSLPDNRRDVLLMHVEARSLFGVADGDQILLGDWKPGQEQRVATEHLRSQLEAIVRTGCRVYVFLDIVHDRFQDKQVKDARDQWIRQLLDAGVSCFVASKDKPSLPELGEKVPPPGNRLFAESIRHVFNDQYGDLSFGQFAEAARKQAARSLGEKDYDPDYLNSWSSPRVDPRGPFITDRGPKQ